MHPNAGCKLRESPGCELKGKSGVVVKVDVDAVVLLQPGLLEACILLLPLARFPIFFSETDGRVQPGDFELVCDDGGERELAMLVLLGMRTQTPRAPMQFVSVMGVTEEAGPVGPHRALERLNVISGVTLLPLPQENDTRCEEEDQRASYGPPLRSSSACSRRQFPPQSQQDHFSVLQHDGSRWTTQEETSGPHQEGRGQECTLDYNLDLEGRQQLLASPWALQEEENNRGEGQGGNSEEDRGRPSIQRPVGGKKRQRSQHLGGNEHPPAYRAPPAALVAGQEQNPANPFRGGAGGRSPPAAPSSAGERLEEHEQGWVLAQDRSRAHKFSTPTP
eukprot:596664-Hanusia_phi.AAC.4